MPEIFYRSDEHRFSVYRLRDIPDGVPRSGWSVLHDWQDGSAMPTEAEQRTRGWLTLYSRLSDFPAGVHNACAAVADEHAGPLLAPRFTVGMRVRPSAAGLRFSTDLKPGRVVEVSRHNERDDLLRIHEDGKPERQVWFAPREWEPDPSPAPLTIGQRVRLSERGRAIYRALWTGVVTAAPTAQHVEVRRDSDGATMPYAAVIWEPEPVATQPTPIDPIIASYLAGAESGDERRIDYTEQRDGIAVRDSVIIHAASAAWSRSLRVLVRQSDEERKRQEDARVGWDPYGEEP